MKTKLFLIGLFSVITIHSNLYSIVYVNQAGYRSSLPKYFYTDQNVSSFQVIETSTGNIFFSGQVQLYRTNDGGTGKTLYKGEFSSLTRPGIYQIKLSNNDTSYSFPISENVFDDVYRKSLKAFYFQRCGSQLFYQHAGVYQRSACHTGDGFYHSSTGQSGFKYSRGGWHDAGDYGKYVVNGGISVVTLLMAYEYFPELFASDNLNIPESGNGIPDILDEVRYEIQWFLTMQGSDGAVHHKLTKEQFENFVMPSQDSGMRYLYQKSSTATGNFIAALAKFSRLYKNYDSVFSNQCLTAAINGWNWLVNQSSIFPPGGFTNPSGTQTGEYGDGNDLDERLWAAAELFETTGDEAYKNYFDFNYNLGGLINSTMNWQNVRTLAHLTYLFSAQPTADQSVKSQLLSSLIQYCNSLLSKSNSNGFAVTLNPGEYYWGSNSQVLNNAILLILVHKKTQNENYLKAAIEQFNYILGANVHNLSFVTGIGSKSPMKPHHRPSEADGIIEPIPGLLVGGPNQYLNDPILQQYFNQNTPPALCYIDHLQSYASNEIAINWNAPLVFVSGFFNGALITGVEDNLNYLPETIELEQNYPNPFSISNSSETKIKFTIGLMSNDRFNKKIDSKNLINQSDTENFSEPYLVKLILYDILGREITTILDGYLQAGRYEITLRSDIFRSRLSSGIYFYKLQVRNQALIKKMNVLN